VAANGAPLFYVNGKWNTLRKVPPCDARPKSEREKAMDVTVPKDVKISVKRSAIDGMAVGGANTGGKKFVTLRVTLNEAEDEKLKALAAARGATPAECVRAFIRTSQPGGGK
jgi:hypothetical protein